MSPHHLLPNVADSVRVLGSPWSHSSHSCHCLPSAYVHLQVLDPLLFNAEHKSEIPTSWQLSSYCRDLVAPQTPFSASGFCRNHIRACCHWSEVWKQTWRPDEMQKGIAHFPLSTGIPVYISLPANHNYMYKDLIGQMEVQSHQDRRSVQISHYILSSHSSCFHSDVIFCVFDTPGSP